MNATTRYASVTMACSRDLPPLAVPHAMLVPTAMACGRLSVPTAQMRIEYWHPTVSLQLRHGGGAALVALAVQLGLHAYAKTDNIELIIS